MAIVLRTLTTHSRTNNSVKNTATKLLERLVYNHPRFATLMEDITRIEHWFDKGGAYASAEFVTFLLEEVHERWDLKISAANHFGPQHGRFLADAVISTDVGLANHQRNQEPGYTIDVAATCAAWCEEFESRRKASDWNGDKRVAHEALFIPYRGPNGDGSCVDKPTDHALTYDFPKGTMHATGMQRRMTITEGDRAWRGIDEDVVELFAYSDLAHDTTTQDGQHALRGVSLDTEHRKRFRYRNLKFRRRRNPKAENLELMVKPSIAKDRQEHRDQLEIDAHAADEARWERVGRGDLLAES